MKKDNNNTKTYNTDKKLHISDVRDSRNWWDSLSSIEKDEYFDMYYKDMEKMDLLRCCDVDELDSDDIEQIYNDYYL
jgi:hypothetical protein